MDQSRNLPLILISVMILLAAFSRLIPHWPNFTAVGAMALFGAAQFRQKWLAFAVPFLALYLSDLVINNVIYGGYYNSFVWQFSAFTYGAFALIILLGFWLRNNVKVTSVISTSIAASVIFFLVTNFGSWVANPMYTKDMTGLLAAYGAGIPFFWNTLAGDFFFCGVLFGGYALVSRYYLAPQTA